MRMPDIPIGAGVTLPSYGKGTNRSYDEGVKLDMLDDVEKEFNAVSCRS